MFKKIIFTSLCLLLSPLSAEEKNTSSKLFENKIEVSSSLKILGKDVGYKAITGNLVLKDDKEKEKASFFYVSYFKETQEKSSKRPITFCFNGGPGSSSVWLHLGLFGPKVINTSKNQGYLPPYELDDNIYSLLDTTDLVFIDPVSTGFSRAAQDEDAKQFHTVDEDIKSVANFIRLFTTKFERWDSPKFIAGESYGTARAAGVAAELHDEHFYYINGIILVSSVLDFQTLGNFEKGNDLPFILYLPSYTAAAFYHKKLNPELQKDFKKTLSISEDFALNEYALALLKGDLLTPEERQNIINKYHALTGISKKYIEKADLRVNSFQFRKELLGNEERNIGRFDARTVGIILDPLSEYAKEDPSFDAVLGVFTAAFNQYVRKDLNWKQDIKYEILANVFPWNYGNKNEYLNLSKNLKEVMTRNPYLKVFVANGYFDLATPYFATNYTFNHINLDPSLRKNINMAYYHGGHMMYFEKEILKKVNDDIRSFIQNSLLNNSEGK